MDNVCWSSADILTTHNKLKKKPKLKRFDNITAKE